MAGPRRRATSKAADAGGAAGRPAPKDEFVLVRLTGADRDRLRRTAARDYLEMSTWARRAILQALDRAEAEMGAPDASPGTDAGNGEGGADTATARDGTRDGPRHHKKRGIPDTSG